MTIKEILMDYNTTKSIRKTAQNLEVSECTVHKALVTYGVIDTPLTRRIAELRRIGQTQSQIAEMLHLSTSHVNKNTPYERGSYLQPSSTVNAQRIRKCRGKE